MLIESGESSLPALFLAIDTHNQERQHCTTILLSVLDSLTTIDRRLRLTSNDLAATFESYYSTTRMSCPVHIS